MFVHARELNSKIFYRNVTKINVQVPNYMKYLYISGENIQTRILEYK
jgi:hypothetical protein